jgi:hypothetical protein
VAIIQISRIQHRRGREGVTGMPQLSSGELGWAIDTQSLYIGNGSVSEGAPAVGNTKIITEHDNLLDLANTYAYKSTNNLWGSTAPVQRSLQDRLDDTVSIKAFGATGNGSDQTTAIQGAIDKLYVNGEITNRVKLYFPPGEYLVSSTIKLPPFVNIIGAGKDKTKIYSTTGDVFETVNGTYPGGGVAAPGATTSIYDPSPNQPRYIEIRNITVESPLGYTGLRLLSCANSKFTNIKFRSTWTVGATDAGKALELNGDSSQITCMGNVFINLEIDSYRYCVYSDFDIKENIWEDCIFYNADYGIVFGQGLLDSPPSFVIGTVGHLYGAEFNTITNCRFENIAKHGFRVVFGEYNKSSGNRYISVGNDLATGTAYPPATPVIAFSSNTNLSESDYFERTAQLARNNNLDVDTEFYAQPYLPEVDGNTKFVNKFTDTISIGYRPVPIDFLKVPYIEDGTIWIDYIYTESFTDTVRKGTIEIINNPALPSPTISEEYTHTGDPAWSTAITWTTSYENYAGGGGSDTIGIQVENLIPVATDSFVYTISYKS